MAKHTSKPTKEQRDDAKMHATVWESVFHTAQENANRRTDIDRGVMGTLAVFALMIGGEYRRIANGKEIDD